MEATGPKGTAVIDLSDINNTPTEIKKLILSFLTNHDPFQAREDLRNFRLVSRAWQKIVLELLRDLWVRNERQWVPKFRNDFHTLLNLEATAKGIGMGQNLSFKKQDQMLKVSNKLKKMATGTIAERKLITDLRVIRDKIRWIVDELRRQGLDVPASMESLL